MGGISNIIKKSLTALVFEKILHYGIYRIQSNYFNKKVCKRSPLITSVDRGCPFSPAPKEENQFLQEKNQIIKWEINKL